MKFAIYHTFPAFFKALRDNSTVYITAYTERPPAYGFTYPPTKPEEAKRFVLLTSDAGGANMIHVIQIMVTDKAADDSEPHLVVYEKVVGFLREKGAKIREGILLTHGLQDALKVWGQTSDYTSTEITELLESGQDVKLGNEPR